MGWRARQLLGAAIGMLIGVSRFAQRALGPLLEFCRALPPPVIVPVAILLLGYGANLKLLVVTWAAVWPILLNTASATRLIDPLLLDVGRTFRLGAARTLAQIVAPAIVPGFLLGVRVAVPLAIIITLLVEMLTLAARDRQPDRAGAARIPVGPGLRPAGPGRNASGSC